jgi:hypothetical protein
MTIRLSAPRRLSAAIALLVATLAPAPAPAAPTATQPTATSSARPALPKRPEEITFEPLAFEPPDAKTFRRTLPDGTIAYLAPSRELPLVTVSVTFRGGSSLDPAIRIRPVAADGTPGAIEIEHEIACAPASACRPESSDGRHAPPAQQLPELCV